MLASVKKGLRQKVESHILMNQLNRQIIKLSPDGERMKSLLREAIIYMVDCERTKIMISRLSPEGKALLDEFRQKLLHKVLDNMNKSNFDKQIQD